MMIIKKTLQGIILGCCFSLVTAFDGMMRILNSSHTTGSLNYVFAAFMCGIFFTLLLFRIGKLFSEMKVFNSFMTVVSVLASALTAVFTVVFNQNFVALTVELTYLFMFCGAFLVYKVFIASDELVCRAFFSSVVVISGLVLPLLALGLSWFSVTGRFEGIYAASSLSGNIAALIAAFIITSQMNWYRRSVSLVVFCVSALIIVLTGTRSALLIVLVAGGLKMVSMAKGSRIAIILLGVCGLGMVTIWLVPTQTVSDLWSLASGSSRILAVEDEAEVGSLATRLQWIILVIDDIRANGVFGGFGPGEAREYIGTFLHLDLLKTYYDYSLFGLISLMSAAYFSCRKSSHIAGLRVMLIMFLLSMHNLVVSPILLLFATPFLVTDKYALHT